MTRHQDRLQQVQLLLAMERLLQPKSQRQLTKEVRQIAAVIEDAPTPSLALMSTISDTISDFRPAWVSMLSTHYARTGRVFGARVVVRVREQKATQDIFRSSMARFIRQWGLEKAKQITTSTRDFVRDQLVKGIEEGLGTREIARSIRDQISGIGHLNPQQRSLVIARTETHTSANFAQGEAVRAMGLDNVQREWLAVEDARTRETHSAADGQTVGMDEPFRVGGASLMYPGDPTGPGEETINCRCVLGFIGAEE